jgi:hypothetical protein
MGLDEPQMRFATRLQTGEALVYSDEFAEAAHIAMPAGPLAAQPGPLAVAAAIPFHACDTCRSKCLYRGPALSMVYDPVVVARVKDAVAALEVKGMSAADVEAKWATLLTGLRDQVALFPSLPSVDPEQSDIAYCLFLHALAVRTMRFSPAWPAAVATRLGITG